jgi:hypothetical protein
MTQQHPLYFQVFFDKKDVDKRDIARYLRIVFKTLSFGDVEKIHISTHTWFDTQKNRENVIHKAHVFMSSWHNTLQNEHRQQQLMKKKKIVEFYNSDTPIICYLPEVQEKHLINKNCCKSYCGEKMKIKTEEETKIKKQEKNEEEEERWFNGEVTYDYEDSLYE